ncbi:RNA-binding protein [Phormidium sp. CLA17]|uniref:Jag family protein n=1 Tax=Leptolyngbya sp. Cla-17 TaxID=2803751 RepID=UPI001491CC26|nr:R3H domain-containing nucleic acid-binding protein [Leptolyngbya sp. Cla-17]MBM0741923.1 RNA-binding protein [Leptolyngbya sp. Cla-17]
MDTSREQRGQQWLEELLQHAAIPTSIRSEKSPEFWEDSCWLVIDEKPLALEQIQALIGAEGTVIDSLQYLANTILNLGQESGHQGAFTVDLAGYRLRRYSELQAIAEKAATEARETGTEVELKALSAAERRQVHTILKEHTDLETQSRGQEPDRRLVVSLVKGTP